MGEASPAGPSATRTGAQHSGRPPPLRPPLTLTSGGRAQRVVPGASVDLTVRWRLTRGQEPARLAACQDWSEKVAQAARLGRGCHRHCLDAWASSVGARVRVRLRDRAGDSARTSASASASDDGEVHGSGPPGLVRRAGALAPALPQCARGLADVTEYQLGRGRPASVAAGPMPLIRSRGSAKQGLGGRGGRLDGDG